MLGEYGVPKREPRKRRRTPMNVRPLRDRVLVKRVEAQEQKIGGVIIPDTAKEKPQQATVIAVGRGRVNDDRKKISLAVEAGGNVVIGTYSGTEGKLEGG